MFQILPSEALDHIFQYCTPAECLSNRRVCRLWRGRLTGCALIEYSCPPMLPYFHVLVEQIRIVGTKQRRVAYANASNRENDRNDDRGITDKGLLHRRKRIRGHLPEPQVQLSVEDCSPNDDDESLTLPRDFTALPSCGTAFRLEAYGEAEISNQHGASNGYYWNGMNLAESTIVLPRRQPMQPSLVVDLSNMRRSKVLKYLLKHVDLCTVSRLERLSVRGCPNLLSILIPTNLEALDASSCSRLVTISMPLFEYYCGNDEEEGIARNHLKALNLNGSRKLRYLFTTETAPRILKYLQEFDASSVQELASSYLPSILRQSVRLESLSLRYVATNNLLDELAKSTSACGLGNMEGTVRESPSLQLLDVAFSRALEDSSVNHLVAAAPQLERLNLRGCTAISGSCYNRIPVLLTERRHRQQHEVGIKTRDESGAPSGQTELVDELSMDRSTRQRRKGDNIFYFTQARNVG